MATSEHRRVASFILDADYDTLIAIRNMEDYRPANAAYTLSALNEVAAALDATHAAELNAQHALDAARSAAMAAERHFHDQMLGAKDQVIAQYGANSDQVAALGLKKKSERKCPTRREPQPEVL